MKPEALPPLAVKLAAPFGATLALGGLTLMPGPMETEIVALLPSESTTFTTSVTFGAAPAVYAPVPALMLPPEGADGIDHMKPVPLPPDAENATPPRGGALGVAGRMDTPAPTEMVAVVLLPTESVTLTTSVWFGVAPAVYAPVVGTMLPPDGDDCIDHMKPKPLPPLAMNDTWPLGGDVGLGGVMVTLAPTFTEAVALLPSESITFTTSVTFAVGPAEYAPVLAPMLPPDGDDCIDHAKPVPLPPLAVKVFAPLGATLALGGVMPTAGPTVTLTVVELPSESTTFTTSVTLPSVPAVYAPVVATTLPPEGADCIDQLKPEPLPPDALKLTAPFGVVLGVAGRMEMPAPTVTLTVAVLPSRSVTFTTSVTLPVVPAVYTPVVAITLPPEGADCMDQLKPEPLPPDALKLTLPLGVVLGAAGRMLTPAVTVMFAVAVLPSESVTFTTSVTLPVVPAEYAPVEATTLPPDGADIIVHVRPLPLPPDAPKAMVPFGALLGADGEMLSAAVTVTLAVAVLPSESVTFTTSVTLPVVPAV
jgi:hypothetical protein